MKNIFSLSIFLLFCWIGQSQTFTLEGKVTKNQFPLQEASVKVAGQNLGTYTDIEGNYSLQLSEGIYEIIFTYGNQKKVQIELNANRVLDVDLTNSTEILNEILISTYRVDADSPITHSNLTQEEIRKRNLGQDVPILMNYMPNVVTTSDAGAGVGYTGIRVRGSDAGRINVTINGIPLNDAESQGTFWVNLGDFTSSIQDLQLQRGVGTSTNGAGAFGASLNIATEKIDEKASAQISNSYGSFQTRKHQVEFNTGLLDDKFAFSGNFSILKSDGYIDRAFSDMKSYFLQGVYQHKQTRIKALAFGGIQQTYQAYFGIDKEQLKENRRFNPAGMYEDDEGNIQFYDNQTDNYKQDHLQLIWNQQYNSNWSSNLSFHHTLGEGYYDSYRQNADLEKYGLTYIEGDDPVYKTDLTNQKWLDNYFFGSIFDVTYKKKGFQAILGGGGNYYSGDHYGKVFYTKHAINPEPFKKYYDNKGTKTDFNLFTKVTYHLNEDLAFFGDLQWRNIHYKTDGPYEGENFKIEDEFNFFNPKFGITYQVNWSNHLYASFARANREPNRSDYKAAVLGNENYEYPKAEQLNDFELGWRYNSEKIVLNTNLYWMDYHNQLVLTGEIDPEGRALRKNSGKSYRIGIEVDAAIKITDQFNILPNISFSENKNKDFTSETANGLENYGNTPISFSPNLIIGNQLQYQPIKNLSLNFLSKFVGEQYMTNTGEKAAKLDSYFVSDLNVQYTWETSKVFDKMIFTGLVNNIFDKKYVSNGYYDPVYGGYYFPQAGIHYLAGMTLVF